MYTSPVGNCTVTFRSWPCRVLDRDQRQRVEIVGRVALLLPPVRIQRLAEIALLIEQPDAHQRIVLVARGFQMIAGENAQTARIHRQALGQAVLGGKVSNQLAIGRRRRLLDAGVEGLASQLVQRQVAGIGSRLVQSRLRHPAQHQHRVVSAVPPQRRVKAPEEGALQRLPAPQDVVGQLRHPGKRRRQSRPDQKLPNRLYVKRHTPETLFTITNRKKSHETARRQPRLRQTIRRSCVLRQSSG